MVKSKIYISLFFHRPIKNSTYHIIIYFNYKPSREPPFYKAFECSNTVYVRAFPWQKVSLLTRNDHSDKLLKNKSIDYPQATMIISCSNLNTLNN